MLASASPRSRHQGGRWPTLIAGLPILLTVLLLLAAAWRIRSQATPATAPPEPAIEAQGRRFVQLALTLGALSPNEVDSYFGPADLKPVTAKPSLPELRADLADLSAHLHETPGEPDRRRAKLIDRTDRLLALVNTMGDVPPLTFDDEASLLYGLPPAALDEAAFAQARAALDRLLPGSAPLADRVEAFRHSFVIPEDKRAAVFLRALGECRRRTLQHWALPAAERVDVHWTDTVDAAWHRYRGNYRSSLEINPHAVAFLGSAIDVACHEGYPGHHVQFTLADVASGGLPIEDRVVLLRSTGSVLREGAADFAVSLVFPPADRLAFERDVLMPLAGLPAADAAHFEHVRGLLYQLAPAAYPILRAYRDGKLDENSAAIALRAKALIASPQALLEFTSNMGAYVAGYTAVREQVRQSVMGGGPDAAWYRLRCLITTADDAPLALSAAPCFPTRHKAHP